MRENGFSLTRILPYSHIFYVVIFEQGSIPLAIFLLKKLTYTDKY